MAGVGVEIDADVLRRLLAGLAACRRRRGLSRAEVARRMQTTRAVVARLEDGDPGEALQVRTVLRYARAVEASLGWLAALPSGMELFRPVEDGVGDALTQPGVLIAQQRQAAPARDCA